VILLGRRRSWLSSLFFCLISATFVLCGQTQAQKEPQKKKAARPAPVMRAAVLPVNIEQWLFQQDQNAQAARRRLERMLALQVECVDRACQLTDDQKKMLQLAGTGDIVHFFDRYEALKQQFDGARQDDQEKMQQFWQVMRPLQSTLQNGPFEYGSVLDKSLHRSLTPEQLARYNALAKQGHEFRRRAAIELTVASIEEYMPLSNEQRQGLVTLMLSRVKLPRKQGHEYQILGLQFAKIPEDELKPLFDAMQWKIVSWYRDRFKGLEQGLKQNEAWPEKEETD